MTFSSILTSKVRMPILSAFKLYRKRIGRVYMKNSEVLKDNEDFREIYRTGKSLANKYLIMYLKKNELNINRLGISVSKKVGNSVIRHRITRLIRESYRLSEDSIMIGFDIIVVARAGAKGKDFGEIESAFLHLIKLHKIGKNIGS